MASHQTLADLRDLLSVHGLRARGVASINSANRPPGLASDIRSVVLVGHAGSAHWSAFTSWLKSKEDAAGTHSLDRWSIAVLEPIAERLGGQAVYPFQKPYLPFQSWAMVAEGLKPSPLGILIHPEFGLWHGYRGAIALADSINEPRVTEVAHPCDACADKPCLATCPVGAVTREEFNLTGCREHLATSAGHACMTRGCLARLACPVGQSFQYDTEQQRFHMAALA